MEMTEEQRKRAEANRAAAIAKRKLFLESQKSNNNPWQLFRCQKLSQHQPLSEPHKFLARLEICSPDSFSITPLPLPAFPFPGHRHCLTALNSILSHLMPSHFTQTSEGLKASVYKLHHYCAVLKHLKGAVETLQVEEIPWATFNVVERLSHSFAAGMWTPLRPEHLTDEEVDRLIAKLPRSLLHVLLPFQLDGLRFALRRGARCLIADDMGLGKTLQAIAIAGCFLDEGSVLVVCPAVLRFSWAEELERWLPFCLPADIHLVFGHQDNPIYLTRSPRVVVISYTMLHRLRKNMLEREWALLIVDESHHVRCTKKTSEPGEIKAVLDVASRVKRIILLSGTPLSRPYDIYNQINMLWPGLLGKTKYEFAKTYCDFKYIKGVQGKYFADYSRGIRLEELNVLLKQTVMIRRLKEHVLLQLPQKRRQIIRLLLKRSDIVAAKTVVGVLNIDACERASEDMPLENLDEPDGKLSYQELGIAKLSGFREWLSLHPLIAGSENASKMIIFAHHLKVLDGIQEFICEKGIGFVRIDGNTLARDRQSAVVSFQSSPEVKVAIIGILAAGFGLDFSMAQDVVFLELPKCPTVMLQAEDRAHRRGQTNAVNVYIFCAKDTLDESHWKNLNKSLQRVSSTTDGKYNAMKEIEVKGISYLNSSLKADSCEAQPACKDALSEAQLDKQPSAVNSNASEENQDDNSDEGNFVNKSIQSANIMADNAACEDLGKASVLGGTYDVDVFDANERCSEKSFEDKNQLQDMKSISTTQTDHNQPVHPVETDRQCSNQVDSLRFEVSPYTGRIHLYTCILGTDKRPQPLYENFRPEELELLSFVDGEKQKVEFISLKDDPAYRHALLAFAEEWKNLRSIERRKLLGKPLQLPLAVELCYLSESNNHNNKGLLNGGSRRRMTPLMEISHPLPSDAVWKKVYLRSGLGKKEKEYTQGWSLTDEPLCKLCQKQCLGTNAKTPEFFEDLFCNLVCYEEYRMRTSNRFVRQELFQIEHGVCTNCHLDCHKLVEHIRPLSLERRREYIDKVAPQIANRKNMLEKLVNDPTEGNAWHADHIVPVYQGGGECKLENMRTLCVACHYDVTAAQCAERRITRANARKQLKVLMNNMKNGIKGIAGTNIKDHSLPEEQGSVLEDELLVKVPGSAYSLADSLTAKKVEMPPGRGCK
ncbi:DNA annealing helicase and endonuclease ZRANB3 [Abrus precatorius]|uniref:DNA annealing helicase and endonuclease ZRANB3 n=1 Tax=Abrus precatorius TaxID=3816 RepID=A0A8B8MI81_ABRPR|nr:DNA annealing helicase and endonuclease ZRANB3 [Abrus precatorius]